ncbi:hypothetical protein NY2A_b369L [Paramecium bursaria Chlorella virus NY2A]|uniref:Uncharacterized protein b369L n=1 Tax=Paramecium bursaria Chlorella virus NY2A TaxID=46021 RepID=A7IWP4_PBCVN|nr:hypothetical protein NY2A_b369L [Paramecium bursaria Chlorella virus NY2A]ABT14768.1 hypothetical protein NY2A_b369L [Paramecium bursaria Chlorella virus NY2A]
MDGTTRTTRSSKLFITKFPSSNVLQFRSLGQKHGVFVPNQQTDRRHRKTSHQPQCRVDPQPQCCVVP